MSTHHTSRRSFRISILVLTIVLLPLAVHAEEPSTRELAERLADDERYEVTKGFGDTGLTVIPAAAFSSKGNNAASNYYKILSGYYQGTGVLGGCIQAPVYLPQGAEVTSMFVSFYDNDPGETFSVTMTRTSTSELNDAWDMASITTSTDSSGMQTVGDSSIQYPFIEYPGYTYWVSTCLPAVNTRLYSVRIYYDNDNLFTDGFEAGNTSAWTETTF